MIREMTGDILKTTCAAIVNPVNTEGVMGAGLASQIKDKYPSVFSAYAFDCRALVITPGSVTAYKTYTDSRTILCMATKGIWRNPSQLVWVEKGIKELEAIITRLDIKSIAIPKIGCGLGGLDWHTVYPMIKDMAKRLPNITIEVYL